MTRTAVVYDTVYGNTELVAEIIARTLEAEGHTVRLVRAKDALRGRVEGDLLFLGSPTRIGTMTGRMKKVVRRLDPDLWVRRPVAVFDTEMQGVIDEGGASAAAKMHDIARSKGIKVHTPVLKVGVDGMRGPLSKGSDTAVEAYVREVLHMAGLAP